MRRVLYDRSDPSGHDVLTLFYRPQSVSILSKSGAGKENGAIPGELDEASRLKAESRFFSYYQLQRDPDPDAQGPAPFH
jgi:pre-mRNA-processing factor 39